jgi:hypothetical protein
MNGHCPAGKCECENFIVSNIVDNAPPFCHLAGESYYPIKHYEECPWPSRQVPVIKPIKLELTDYGRGWKEGHAAGRLAGLQEAMEAVKKLGRRGIAIDFEKCHETLYRNEVLAAIDRLMEGK